MQEASSFIQREPPNVSGEDSNINLECESSQRHIRFTRLVQGL